MRHSTGRKESDTLDADSLDRPTEGCNSDQHHDLPAPCLPSESVRRASSSDHRSVRCPRGPRCDVCVCVVVGARWSSLHSLVSARPARVRSPVDDICAESRRQVLCVTTRVYHTSFVISNMHRIPSSTSRWPSPIAAASLTHHSMSHRPPQPVTRHHTKLHTLTLHDTHRLTPRSHISQLHIDTSQALSLVRYLHMMRAFVGRLRGFAPAVLRSGRAAPLRDPLSERARV